MRVSTLHSLLYLHLCFLHASLCVVTRNNVLGGLHSHPGCDGLWGRGNIGSAARGS
jgi:hypothetical protein